MPKIIFFFQVNSKNSKESILKNLTFRSWRRIFFNRYCRINFLHFSTFFSDIQNHLIFRSAFFSQPFTPWSLHEFQKQTDGFIILKEFHYCLLFWQNSLDKFFCVFVLHTLLCVSGLDGSGILKEFWLEFSKAVGFAYCNF